MFIFGMKCSQKITTSEPVGHYVSQIGFNSNLQVYEQCGW